MENLIHVFNALDLNGYFTSNDYKSAYSTLNNDETLASCTLYNFLKRLTMGGFISSEPIAILTHRGPRKCFKKLKNIPGSMYWIFKGSQSKIEHKMALASKKEIESYSPDTKVEMSVEDYEKFKRKYFELKEERKQLKASNCEMMDELQSIQTQNRILSERISVKADLSFLDDQQNLAV